MPLRLADQLDCSHTSALLPDRLPGLLLTSATGDSVSEPVKVEKPKPAAALEKPKRPLIAIVAGSKVSTKLTVLESLLTKVDKLIVGGGIANTFLAATGVNVGKSLHEAEMLDVAMELERIALTDEYFIEKKLYPNIDFYSGITLRAMGFPSSMFTVLFALARTVGWIAQWIEMFSDPDSKLNRPRQLFCGPATRDFVPVDKRK